MHYKVIGVLGDSIANGYWDEEGKGWFGCLAEKIAMDFPCKYGFNNMSQSGDRSCDTFHRLAAEALTRTPDILLISTGVNDLIRSPHPSALPDMSENLRRRYWDKILSLLQRLPIKSIVCDILPVCVGRCLEFENNPKIYYDNNDILAYNELLATMCRQYGIPFFQRYKAWENRDLSALYLDVVHPNAAGHKLIADEIFAMMIKSGILEKGESNE